MKRIAINQYFFLDEVINPETYSARGAASRSLMDNRIIEGLTLLRELVGVPFTVNNWASGGARQESGLRNFNTRTGARWSQHKFGRAIDIVPQGLTIAQLFEVVKDNKEKFLQGGLITTVEDIRFTPTWLHIDCRYTGSDDLVIVQP